MSGNRSAEGRRYDAESQRRHRAERRAAGICINGDKHGPATHGVLCEPCRIQHRKSNTIQWSVRREPIEPLVLKFAATIVINTRRKAGGE